MAPPHGCHQPERSRSSRTARLSLPTQGRPSADITSAHRAGMRRAGSYEHGRGCLAGAESNDGVEMARAEGGWA